MSIAIADQKCANCYYCRTRTFTAVNGNFVVSEYQAPACCFETPVVPLAKQPPWPEVGEDCWCGHWSEIGVAPPGIIGATGATGSTGPSGVALMVDVEIEAVTVPYPGGVSVQVAVEGLDKDSSVFLTCLGGLPEGVVIAWARSISDGLLEVQFVALDRERELLASTFRVTSLLP